MVKKLLRKKPLSLVYEEMEGEHRLKRVLGPWSLTSLGIGCVIGAGIFVLTGIAAHDKAGPALILSFVIAGLACIFAAMSYAEFASLAPVAGSAYTYAYTTLGEIFAWIIGWDLVLEYTVTSASVANGWSKYFQEFINLFKLKVSPLLAKAPFDFNPETGRFVLTGSYLDLPAVVIAAIVTVILVIGIRESTRFNNIMVGVKLIVVVAVIAIGAFYVDPKNWQPFAPYGYGGLSFFGKSLDGSASHAVGMVAGAAMVFFAYIGFDSVSTHAEEAKNPQRDVPIGIIASLLICTVLYIAVSAVLTGMVPYDKISIDAPVAAAFAHVGLPQVRYAVAIGAVAGITSVLLVLMLSQPRVLLAMARDGLLPKSFFASVHERFKTPYKSTILTGIVVATLAAFVPLRILAELVNIGTLFAFVVVCIAVIIMRRLHPDIERPFKCPGYPYVPILGIIFCLGLMFSLPWENWVRLFVWMVAGIVIYLLYGRRHSVMQVIEKRTEKMD